MCDTMIATPSATANNVMIFGKNSDREPNEAQYMGHFPAANHPLNSRVNCTYVDIPQVPHTHAVMLSKPFWMWGAEIGVNEHLVTIGNEAVFTKDPVPKKGLLGMDLLRLGLERGATAREALDVITSLIAEFGQGGNGGYMHPLYYHNSFIIADSDEAWVLETSDRNWAALKVDGGYSISNGLTIHKKWDLASPDLVEHAIKKGWCRSAEDFDFAHCYSDSFYTYFSFSAHRRSCSFNNIKAQSGIMDIARLATILRGHNENTLGSFRPDGVFASSQVCMHHGAGPWHEHQTTGSLIAYLDRKAPAFFATFSAAPCTSIFKPLWLDTPLPERDHIPGGKYNRSTYFWRHENLHRATIRDYPSRIKLYSPERDTLENEFFNATMDQMRFKNANERAEFVHQCFEHADLAETQWLQKVSAQNVHNSNNIFYNQVRFNIDKQAEMV